MAARFKKERRDLNGGLAQLGERLPCKQEVTSSTLVFSTLVIIEQLIATGRRSGEVSGEVIANTCTLKIAYKK